MKIVTNKIKGSFNLSALAILKLAERKGYSCHFFNTNDLRRYFEISLDEAQQSKIFFAFKTSKVEEVIGSEDVRDYIISRRPGERNDIDLVSVVEELGENAEGESCKLQIVDIPDDVDWNIFAKEGREFVVIQGNKHYPKYEKAN
jgi:hypothetical protein